MDVPPTARTLLMIPGPTTVSPDVLAAGARPVLSHSDPYFVGSAAKCLAGLRQLFGAPTAQPLLVAGSGTLAMEIGIVNLVEPGDRVLILETGVFARRFASILERIQVEYRIEAAPLGQPIDPERVRRALREFRPKVMTITHVDTSTGVRVDVATLARIGREAGALIVVDGVCSIGGEEFLGDEWGVDVALTASQKAIGGPPGLAMVTVGPRALAARQERRTPFAGFFTDILNWLPVMESYEGGRPAYFGTPAITMIATLEVALEQALTEGIAARLERHHRLAQAFKVGVAALGLVDVAAPEVSANTLTAVRVPSGGANDLVDAVQAEGVTISRPIHPDLQGTSFRVGHMGTCTALDVIATLAAIERGLYRLGREVALGAGLAAAQRALATTTAPVPVGV
jgi:alanine-glyoxylate transaminase / serine-glyoxylate transaminase / serine-pyruvate transaminase